MLFGKLSQKRHVTLEMRNRAQGGWSGLVLGRGMELRWPLEVSPGERPLVELYLEPGGFSGQCTGESLPLGLFCLYALD